MNQWRPVYHFMAPYNWMNDPNGPVQVDGVYHLFYQWNPHGESWGTIHWGHARSRNLVDWEHLPAALTPSTDKGEIHCFSGSCIVFQGRPLLYYTSIGEGERNWVTGPRQWVATTEDMVSWKKADLPALTLDLHGPLEVVDWRDPFVWEEDGALRMVLGGRLGLHGCILSYRSKDGLKWEFEAIVAEGKARVLECPNLFKLGDRWVLLFSPIAPDARVRYQIGTLNGKFQAEQEGIFDYGGRDGYYAPSSFPDEAGRRVVHGWMTDDSRKRVSGTFGWNGVMAVPRELSLVDGGLRLQPVKELEALRTELESATDLPAGRHTPQLRGRAVEIRAVLRWEGAARCEFGLFVSADGKQRTTCRIDLNKGRATVIRRRSSKVPGVDGAPVRAEFPVGDEHVLEVRIFIDHSTVEVFLGGVACLSTRVYPGDDADGLFVSTSSKVKISLDCWKLRPAIFTKDIL